jgi:uncharacterized membrane protein
MTLAITYIVALLIFLALDAIWLTTMGKPFYAAELGTLLREKPDFVSAFGFYLLFIAGLVVFVINPSLASGKMAHAVIFGAFFGLVTYATYDMTNLATMKGFTTRVAVVDMIWGAALSSSVSALTFLIVRALRG